MLYWFKSLEKNKVQLWLLFCISGAQHQQGAECWWRESRGVQQAVKSKSRQQQGVCGGGRGSQTNSCGNQKIHTNHLLMILRVRRVLLDCRQLHRETVRSAWRRSVKRVEANLSFYHCQKNALWELLGRDKRISKMWLEKKAPRALSGLIVTKKYNGID